VKIDNSFAKGSSAPVYEHLLEVLSEAFETGEVNYYKLFLFNNLKRGEKTWHFLIVTRNSEDGRLELAAFSYEIGKEGKLNKKLESRRARIPRERLAEVIDSLLVRIDEPECDYREIDLSRFADRESQLLQLRNLLQGDFDGSPKEEKYDNRLQPGQSG